MKWSAHRSPGYPNQCTGPAQRRVAGARCQGRADWLRIRRHRPVGHSVARHGRGSTPQDLGSGFEEWCRRLAGFNEVVLSRLPVPGLSE